MLTSKEIIERTGISRATLNNYIASGLVPRPHVLPPGPEDGAAPRIGYFPDDTIERIETIQRLKSEGWSITRIAEHFTHPGREQDSGSASRASAGVTASRPPDLAQLPGAAARTPVPLSPTPFAPARAQPGLTPVEAAQAAWLVNESFRLVWINAQAGHRSGWPFGGLGAQPGSSVFELLLQHGEAGAGDALLRFHLEAAGARSLAAADLFTTLPPAAAARLQVLYGAARARPGPLLVAQALLPGAGARPPRWIHAIHFHEGVLFALTPQGEQAVSAAPSARLPAPPRLTPVAVLAGVLQDAAGLWVRLSPEEYFELLNEIGSELDAIFQRHSGRCRGTAGEAVTCYFLPQQDAGYLWNALVAAHEARDTMRQVSQRWQARKGWDLELCLNIGIDEGQDWLGALGWAEEAGLRVLGDAADRAAHLSHAGHAGAVLVTRSLVGKLAHEQRQRITYGVPRSEGTRGEAPLLFTFARLADVTAAGPAPAAVAGLAVAELIALNPPDVRPGSATR